MMRSNDTSGVGDQMQKSWPDPSFAKYFLPFFSVMSFRVTLFR